MPPPWLAACRNFTFALWPELTNTTTSSHPILELGTITACLPLVILVVFIPKTLLTLKKKKKDNLNNEKKRVSWGVVNNIRLLLALLVLVINVVFRLLLALDSGLCFHDIILLAVTFATLVLGIGHLLAVILLHQVTSVTQIIFWASISACNIPHLLDALQLNQLLSAVFILPLLIKLLAFVILVLQWFPYSNQSISN